MTPVGRGTTSQAPARPHTTDGDTLIADQTSITNQESDAAVDNSKLTSLLHGLPGVDQVGLEGRAATLATRSIKKDSKIWAIDTAISMVDLTTLEGMDTDGAATPFSSAFRKRRVRPTRLVWETHSVPASSPANHGVFLMRGQPRSGLWSLHT